MLGFVGSVSMMFFYTVFGTAPAAWVLYVGETEGVTPIPQVTHCRTVNISSHDLKTLSHCFSLSTSGPQL